MTAKMKIKINELIKERILQKYNLQTQGSLELFYPRSLPRFPNISGATTTDTPTTDTPIEGLSGIYAQTLRGPR